MFGNLEISSKMLENVMSWPLEEEAGMGMRGLCRQQCGTCEGQTKALDSGQTGEHCH